MKASASIVISRPIADVFGFVTDVKNMPAWITGVRSAHLHSDAMAEGARYTVDYFGSRRLVKLDVVVTDFDPPQKVSSTTERGPFAFEGSMHFAEVDSGTKVTNVIEAGPDSLATRIASILFGWILRGSMSRRLLRELETLQRSIESDTSLAA